MGACGTKHQTEHNLSEKLVQDPEQNHNTWSCLLCTFENDIQVQLCQMCGNHRKVSPDDSTNISTKKVHNDLQELFIDNRNKETENIEASSKILISDEKKQETETFDDINLCSQNFRMDWMKICECVSHEMWPKLSSIIKSIIRDKNININEI
eukprot:444770_1